MAEGKEFKVTGGFEAGVENLGKVSTHFSVVKGSAQQEIDLAASTAIVEAAKKEYPDADGVHFMAVGFDVSGQNTDVDTNSVPYAVNAAAFRY